jgi:hypothetical protein
MKKFRQSESGDRGWFVGAFERAVYTTDQFEVAYMFDSAGTHSRRHYHQVATEINLITSGCAVVNGEKISAGEGFIFEPLEQCEVYYPEDTYTLCVKTPSVPGDKYFI